RLVVLDACGEERRHALLYLRVDRAVVDERAARRVDEVSKRVEMSGAQLVNLADRAGDWILVALGARLRVVDGPEAVLYFVANFECGAIRVVLRLLDEVVSAVVETDRRFGRNRHGAD